MDQNWDVVAMNNNIIISAAAAAAPQQQQIVSMRALNLIVSMCTFISPFRTTTSASLQMTDVPGEEDQDVHIRGSGSNPDEDADADLQCVICLYDVIKGEKYRLLPDCKHGFHLHCIQAWLHNHSTCPLCRRPVPYNDHHHIEEEEGGTGEEYHPAALHDAILSCVVAFLDHFCKWFVNPLGFDAQPQACDQHPNYLI